MRLSRLLHEALELFRVRTAPESDRPQVELGACTNGRRPGTEPVPERANKLLDFWRESRQAEGQMRKLQAELLLARKSPCIREQTTSTPSTRDPMRLQMAAKVAASRAAGVHADAQSTYLDSWRNLGASDLSDGQRGYDPLVKMITLSVQKNHNVVKTSL